MKKFLIALLMFSGWAAFVGSELDRPYHRPASSQPADPSLGWPELEQTPAPTWPDTIKRDIHVPDSFHDDPEISIL